MSRACRLAESRRPPNGGVSIGAEVKNTRRGQSSADPAALSGAVAGDPVRRFRADPEHGHGGRQIMQRTRCYYFYDKPRDAISGTRGPGATPSRDSTASTRFWARRSTASPRIPRICASRWRRWTRRSTWMVPAANAAIPFDEFHLLARGHSAYRNGAQAGRTDHVGGVAAAAVREAIAIPESSRPRELRVRAGQRGGGARNGRTARSATCGWRWAAWRRNPGGLTRPKACWRGRKRTWKLFGARRTRSSRAARGFRDNSFKIELAKRTIASVLSELADEGGNAMSVMKSMFETVAQFMPDKERDPLVGSTTASWASRWIAWTASAKVKGEARFTAEFQISGTWRMPRWSTARSQRARSRRSTPSGRSARPECWKFSRTRTCPK